MDLSPLEFQPTLDDAYYVVEELLPFIQPNELREFPENVTSKLFIVRPGGRLHISKGNDVVSFIPTFNNQWVVSNYNLDINEVRRYVIDKEDVMKWVTSRFSEPDAIEVKLIDSTPRYIIWEKYGYL